MTPFDLEFPPDVAVAEFWLEPLPALTLFELFEGVELWDLSWVRDTNPLFSLVGPSG